jgi:hypothetical protein
MFLNSILGVEVRSLQAEAESAPEELRTAVVDIWQRIHERRRARRDDDADGLTALRLADHDIENYLGIIARRQKERDSMLGYTSWWLTLDRFAHRVARKLSIFHGVRSFTSPAISPDFMLNYLALGPIRSRLARATEARLPLVAELTAMDLPTDIVAVAEAIRDELSDLPPHIVQRRIHDGLDAGRLQLGAFGEAGMEGVMGRLTPLIQRAAKQGLASELQPTSSR